MLFPKKVKFRKWQTTRRNPNKPKVETRGLTISFGAYGLRAQSAGRLTSNQLEAARRAGSRYLGKTGRLWTRVFPDRPYTQKPAEVGMGKGKGDPQGYEVQVFPGRLIFEVDGTTEAVGREALRKAGAKLPIKVKVVARE